MNKKKMLGMIVIGILVILAFVAWKFMGFGFKKVELEALDIPRWKMEQVISNSNYEDFTDEYDIVRNTDELGGSAAKFYSKYVDYLAPNGKPIRILAMDQVSDDQLIYAYDMLSFYLKSDPGSDKSKVANKMADSNSVLIMPNGADRDGKTPTAAMMLGQNLNQMEVANVGSAWYIECDYNHRDASFEEIFHMVHDYGIGTTQVHGADPEMSELIAQAKDHALPAEKAAWGKEGLWGLSSKSWLEELSKEGSLEQEYIVSVIDAYYGMWEAWEEAPGGMWGMYVAKTRAQVAEKDPLGMATLEHFLPEYITQMMRIDPSFEGEFTMTREEGKPYTTKSQYLQSVRLSGSKDSNISANQLDNVLMGNSGANILDGKAGRDIVQFKGAFAEYSIVKNEQTVIVTDLVKGRDGVNTCKNIEVLRFTDKDIEVETDL